MVTLEVKGPTTAANALALLLIALLAEKDTACTLCEVVRDGDTMTVRMEV